MRLQTEDERTQRSWRFQGMRLQKEEGSVNRRVRGIPRSWSL